MDFGALVLTVAAGGIVDTLASLNKGQEPIVPIMGAGLLIVILGMVGRITGQWTLVTMLAVLYVLSSFLKNWKYVPEINKAFTKGKANG
jgi:hypothetical protein